MNEVFTDHGGIPRSQQGKVSKKASSVAASYYLTGKTHMSSVDGQTINERLD
jgi:hypothetical protein